MAGNDINQVQRPIKQFILQGGRFIFMYYRKKTTKSLPFVLLQDFRISHLLEIIKSNHIFAA